MSKKDQGSIPSPECISERALLEILGGCQESMSDSFSRMDWGEDSWDELDRILYGISSVDANTKPEFRGPMSDMWSQPLVAPEVGISMEHVSSSGQNQAAVGLHAEQQRARARRAFVATLSEWMQMHDYHSPFPNGLHSKGQSCAKVEDEHSSQEKTFCGKLYPRKSVFSAIDRIHLHREMGFSAIDRIHLHKMLSEALDSK
jgi:hypothetical protein